jgi:hypothetical protein
MVEVAFDTNNVLLSVEKLQTIYAEANFALVGHKKVAL